MRYSVYSELFLDGQGTGITRLPLFASEKSTWLTASKLFPSRKNHRPIKKHDGYHSESGQRTGVERFLLTLLFSCPVQLNDLLSSYMDSRRKKENCFGTGTWVRCCTGRILLMG